jgi:hypothetical protein
MVGPSLLCGLRDAVLSARSWREAEAALFALRAVGGPARRAALSPNAAAAPVREPLAALFAELCDPSGRVAGGLLAASPAAHASAAELIGAYAPWFEASEAAPLDGALGLLLAGLSAPPPAPAPSATALRALCSRCAARLGGAPAAAAALSGLAERAAAPAAPQPADGAAAAPAPLGFDERTAVAEALARVAAALPPPDAPAAAAFLAVPYISRARSILVHGGAAAAAGGAAAQQQLLDTLSQEIRLVATTVRRLEFPPGLFAGAPGAPPGAPQHPSLAVLEACWPLLAAVAESPLCRSEARVVEAVCDVFSVSARGRARGQGGGLKKGGGPQGRERGRASEGPPHVAPLPCLRAAVRCRKTIVFCLPLAPWRPPAPCADPSPFLLFPLALPHSVCYRARGPPPSRCCRRCCAQ